MTVPNGDTPLPSPLVDVWRRVLHTVPVRILTGLPVESGRLLKQTAARGAGGMTCAVAHMQGLSIAVLFRDANAARHSHSPESVFVSAFPLGVCP